MSPEERQLLVGLFDRVRNNAGQTRDREAEQFITDAVRSQPYAPYLLAQTVIVQEQALRAANDRLGELEARLQELEAQPKGGGGFLGGLGGLFGGGAAPQPGRTAAPLQSGGPWGGAQAGGPQGWQQGGPQPGGPQQGGWGQPSGTVGQQPAGGGGFLKGALGAAAGVAGGVLLADSIRGLFNGGHNPMGIGSGFGPGIGGASTSGTSDDGGYGYASADGGRGDDGGYGYASASDNGRDDASISDADYSDDGGFGGSDDNGGYDA